MKYHLLECRPITVGYAFKKDAKGERHGTPAERLLAEQQRRNAADQNRPNTLFATGQQIRSLLWTASSLAQAMAILPKVF